eukprot:CAMPEP_0201574190 /NCGR_PEP_ID=MMETSP0190_2-20130828/18510_1 /ASSEMBLY_ACC=CAM_ASM_000263 /TAXON_ID=37353 /ORGANISM="Rosalina sp." /LENGTH=305 /DNA_ID=CAMNT_0048002091 /DNA_START=24 /DNA_END=944 /DNA_ORIENTATION=-
MAAKAKKGKHGGQIVKYTSGKHKFEVIAKQGTVLKYRDGNLGFANVLMVDNIFTNSTRGDIANPSDLNEVFGTEDLMKCCEEIVNKGQLQYTAQERKAFVDAKTNEIVYYINKNYVDPKTKLPHPSDRISNCMKECHIRVDANKDTKRQAEDAVKKMRGKLMFAKAVSLRAKLTIKHAYVGQCTNLVHKIANVIKEDWTGEGCVFTLELSKADINTLTVALAKPTNGDYNMTFLDENELSVGSQNDDSSDKHGKGKKKKKKRDKKNKKQKYVQEAKVNDNDNDNESYKGKGKKKKKKNKSGGGQQ